ncbi:hypothetical protein [Oceanobacillus saliphilus]|uniref:hypothetical protein n=1 Tax=Oceanobacillus saliphilus TaxID=2925834 RepID=UPI00201D7F16|nr:hypothetical protein [Oceanobacillus saliphilus]
MRAEKEKLPPTLAELFAEARDEGREEAKKMLAQELIRENFSDDHIAKLTKLKVEEVARLRGTL